MTWQKFLVAVLVGGLALVLSGCGANSSPDSRDSEDEVPRTSREPTFGIEERTPWTTSHVTGTPEPPPPYKTERVFPKMKFQNPVLIKPVPGSKRYLVAEQRGKIVTFVDDPASEKSDVAIDIYKDVQSIDPASEHQKSGECYGFAFHPKFSENRTVFVCYVMSSKVGGKQQPDGSRVSKFTMTDSDPPKIDPKSEQVVFTWLGGGHNGGCLEFGPDGYLYISTGDGSFTNPPDALLAGQDETRVLCSVLRIDVDNPEGDKPYSIPKDNPFVDLPGARGEKWAYGFRNPWRMTFDSDTGDLWVGDVGWELFEMVYHVEKGGNYGWSVVEGKQSVRPELKRGPTPIQQPAIDLPHSMAASITGGYVYHGKLLPELAGKYVFGDWETRRMWAATWDQQSKTVTKMDELVEPALRIVCYGETPDRELLVMDYDDGTIHQLVRNEITGDMPPFPTKLSETGLFESVEKDSLAPGVYSFSVNAPMWADGLFARRFIGLPETSSVVWHQKQVAIPGTIFNRVLEFPKDTVLMKTIMYDPRRGTLMGRKKVETQILHFNGRIWRGYSYRWNDDQSDALLVEAEGLDASIPTQDMTTGEKKTMTYHFASRAECVRCHNPWAQHALAFSIPQLNRVRPFENGVRGNQLGTFEHVGLLVRDPAEGELGPSKVAKPAGALTPEEIEAAYKKLPTYVNPYDESADLDAKARTYLQVNCAHCHQLGGGGTADIELRSDFPIEKTKTLGLRPMQGTFNIHEAHILSPGDPYRSVMYWRMSTLGKGRMPHIGSHVLDEAALKLMYDWIRQLPIHTVEEGLITQLKTFDEPALVEKETKETSDRQTKLAEQLARERVAKERADKGEPELKGDEKIEPTVADRDAAVEKDEADVARRTAERLKQRTELLSRLLGSSSSALVLARSIQAGGFPTWIREQVVTTALASPDVLVRELFEQFVPEEKRTKRLGSVVRPNELLSASGDAEHGRKLFFETPTVQCKNCHRIGEVGSKLGPDLSQIGKKLMKPQILESILEPSKQVDPKYVMWLVETTSGKVVTGLMTERNDKEIVLRNAKDEEIRIPANEAETIVPQRQSLMPELQLRDMTKEDVIDLLEFLSSLK